MVAAAALAAAAPVAAQQPPAMPAGMTHEQHMAQMKEHGNAAMGFDQDKATHHFFLTPGGGSIQVTANDPADDTTIGQVRAHLQEIAASFTQGDFTKPLMTHDELPPGVTTMRRRADEITYTYEPLEGGGRVRIATANADALDAVHDFLRYQIREHETGDPQ
jgi:hypothetical protein